MSSNIQNQLIESLKLKGLLSDTQLDRLKAENLKTKKDFEQLLIENNVLDEEELTQIKAEIFNFPYINLGDQTITINPSILNIIPQKAAKNYQMLAFDQVGDELKIALVNPEDFKAQEAADFLAKEHNLKSKYFLVSETSFNKTVEKYQGLGKEVAEVLDVARKKFTPLIPQAEEMISRLEEGKVVKTAPVSKIVSVIIKHAVEGGASDIHIEPGAKETRVRYRIDGVLHTSLILPSYIHPAVVSRIKVLASLKLDETRRPQDGRVRLNLEGKNVDFRISTLPLIDNEKVVMRILDTSGMVSTLEDLGFNRRHVEIIEQNIKKPHGLFLVTGPTGAGKTTTLYAILNVLNKEEANIVTLEDPVEYYLDGVNQSQINPEAGFNFATGLRSIIRQDPNIIMVGEIRDSETAELAVHAGLTGHIVLSTLHTSDAFGVIPRLIDMKVEPFLITSTVNLVIAQRLVRKICDHCKKSIVLPEEVEKNIRAELTSITKNLLPKNFDFKANKPLVFSRGEGCTYCVGTGYRGRIVIAEIFTMTDELREIIMSGSKLDEIAEEFKHQVMIYLRQDGLLKALKGVTTLEEVMRVTQE